MPLTPAISVRLCSALASSTRCLPAVTAASARPYCNGRPRPSHPGLLPPPSDVIQRVLTRPLSTVRLGWPVRNYDHRGLGRRSPGPLQACFFNRATSGGQSSHDVQSLAEVCHPWRGFNGLIGIESIRPRLQILVDRLQNPDGYAALGATMPRGVLLCGPPGTGKTRAAAAIAAEAGVPMLLLPVVNLEALSRPEALSELRRVFTQATEMAKKGPCVLLLDGIATLGGHFVYALQAEMTCMPDNVLLVATTHACSISDATMRSEPFDWLIPFSLPSVKGRVDILQHHLKGRYSEADVPWESLALDADSFSGADIARWVNDAALLAGHSRASSIGHSHLEDALLTSLHGAKVELKSASELKHTACHEAGHVLVAYALDFVVSGASIHARYSAEGYTQLQLSEDTPRTPERERAQICVLMAGMAAEKLYGCRVAGSSQDLEQARLCIQFLHQEGLQGDLSTDLDDSLTCEILEEEEARACDILKQHPRQHQALAEALLEQGDIGANIITALLTGMKKPQV